MKFREPSAENPQRELDFDAKPELEYDLIPEDMATCGFPKGSGHCVVCSPIPVKERLARQKEKKEKEGK